MDLRCNRFVDIMTEFGPSAHPSAQVKRSGGCAPEAAEGDPKDSWQPEVQAHAAHQDAPAKLASGQQTSARGRAVLKDTDNAPEVTKPTRHHGTRLLKPSLLLASPSAGKKRVASPPARGPSATSP